MAPSEDATDDIERIEEFDDPPGVRDLWIAYGGDPEEYDRMVEEYLEVAQYV